MSTEIQMFGAGGFALAAGESSPYFWDVPTDYTYSNGVWLVTAMPSGQIEGEFPEQRVQTRNLFVLRKGSGAAPGDANKLQLNYEIANIGSDPAQGVVWICLIEQKP